MHTVLSFVIKSRHSLEKEWLPTHLNLEATDQISVLAPLGAALLGARVGQEVHWQMPNGKDAALVVDEILFYLYSAGELHS